MQSVNMESIQNITTGSMVNGLGFPALEERVSGYMSWCVPHCTALISKLVL